MATQLERIATTEQKTEDQERRCTETTQAIWKKLDTIQTTLTGNGVVPGGIRGDLLVLHALFKEHIARDRRRETWMWRLVIGACLMALGTAMKEFIFT
jgi:hypothetical protein